MINPRIHPKTIRAISAPLRCALLSTSPTHPTQCYPHAGGLSSHHTGVANDHTGVVLLACWRTPLTPHRCCYRPHRCCPTRMLEDAFHTTPVLLLITPVLLGVVASPPSWFVWGRAALAASSLTATTVVVLRVLALVVILLVVVRAPAIVAVAVVTVVLAVAVIGPPPLPFGCLHLLHLCVFVLDGLGQMLHLALEFLVVRLSTTGALLTRRGTSVCTQHGHAVSVYAFMRRHVHVGARGAPLEAIVIHAKQACSC